MKLILFFVIVVAANPVFSQSKTEAEVSNLSGKIFTWEVENKIDLLQSVLSEKFRVVTSRGDIQTKQQYIATLSSGNVKHDSIAIQQSTTTIVNKTAIVIGKGWFHMTVSGNKLHRHLSYMEVFSREDQEWKLVALYATPLPD
jgi:hypothetical protein